MIRVAITQTFDAIAKALIGRSQPIAKRERVIYVDYAVADRLTLCAKPRER
jgi:hypothetical protein